MPDKKLTEELLNELLDAPSIDGYIREHDFAAPSLSDYLKQLLQEKGLERSRVVRMADLNETFGYQIFTGARHPSRNKVLQIAFAMALTLKETNRALTAAGANVLNCKDRRCSLQKVNEELYRFGEETVSERRAAGRRAAHDISNVQGMGIMGCPCPALLWTLWILRAQHIPMMS